MKKVLVFDFGASSARATLCFFKDGKFASDEVHRFANTPVKDGDTLYWDIDYLLSEVSTALKKAVKLGFDAVSVDTWGVDFGLFYENGKLMEAPVHYRDERTEGIPEKVYKIISEDELYKRTGIQYMRFNTIFQLYSLKEKRGEFLGKAAKMLLMPDIVCNFLTGEMKSEYTEATTTQLVNPHTNDWDWELIDMLGFERSLFAPIIKAGEIYGYLKEEFGCGRIPVIAAPSHDTASAIAAVPSTEEDFLLISLGTWALFGTELTAPIITEEADALGLTNEGGYGSVTFLRNIMGMWLLQESRRYFAGKGLDYTFPEMYEMAEKAEYKGALIDPNDELFVAPGRMPEKVREYCKAHNQPVPETSGEILRVIYESLAAAFGEACVNMEKITGKTYGTIHIFGGGCRDDFLCRLTAEKTGKKIVRGPIEATSAGNAVCSLITLGEIENLKAARAILAESIL